MPLAAAARQYWFSLPAPIPAAAREPHSSSPPLPAAEKPPPLASSRTDWRGPAGGVADVRREDIGW